MSKRNCTAATPLRGSAKQGRTNDEPDEHDASNSAILAAIHSLRDEMGTRMDALEQRVLSKVSTELSHMEQRVFDRCQESTIQSIDKYHDEVTAKLSAKLDRLVHEKEEDMAKLTAIIHGIPSVSDRSQVEKALKSVKVAFRSLRVFTSKAGNTMGILSFPTVKIRDEYISAFRSSERTLDDGEMKHTLGISPGKSKLQRDRNTALREKLDHLSKSCAPGKKYTIDWMKRTIQLNGVPTHKQHRLSTDITEIAKH